MIKIYLYVSYNGGFLAAPFRFSLSGTRAAPKSNLNKLYQLPVVEVDGEQQFGRFQWCSRVRVCDYDLYIECILLYLRFHHLLRRCLILDAKLRTEQTK